MVVHKWKMWKNVIIPCQWLSHDVLVDEICWLSMRWRWFSAMHGTQTKIGKLDETWYCQCIIGKHVGPLGKRCKGRDAQRRRSSWCASGWRTTTCWAHVFNSRASSTCISRIYFPQHAYICTIQVHTTSSSTCPRSVLRITGTPSYTKNWSRQILVTIAGSTQTSPDDDHVFETNSFGLQKISGPDCTILVRTTFATSALLRTHLL